jgi:hypothetical protein
VKKKAGLRERLKHPGRPGHTGAKRAKVQLLFQTSTRPIRDVAREARIDRATLYRWADEGGWWPAREQSIRDLGKRELEQVVSQAVATIKERHAETGDFMLSVGRIGLNAVHEVVTAPNPETGAPPTARDVLAIIGPQEARQMVREGITTTRQAMDMDDVRIGVHGVTGEQLAWEKSLAGKLKELQERGQLSKEAVIELLSFVAPLEGEGKGEK